MSTISSIEISQLQTCNAALVTYICDNIIPRYASFDKAHQQDHVLKVVKDSLLLAEKYDVNKDMVLAIAAYHDTGLVQGREFHHIHSGEIIKTDSHIATWFSDEQIAIMVEAIEDHRASNTHEPRSIYGKIVAEADRVIDCDITLRRTVQYGLKHLIDGTVEEHYQRFSNHLIEKYSEKGYLKLWLSLPANEIELAKIRELIVNKEALRNAFMRIFTEENEKK